MAALSPSNVIKGLAALWLAFSTFAFFAPEKFLENYDVVLEGKGQSGSRSTAEAPTFSRR